MKKVVILLTGVVFVLGVMLPVSYAQYKKEKNDPLAPIPSQNTIHLEKTDDKATKDMQKDIKTLKGEAPTPAAPEKKAVTATPPVPADTKAPATSRPKKTRRLKRVKKPRRTPKTDLLKTAGPFF